MPVYNPLLRPHILKPAADAAIAIHRGRSKHKHRRVGFRSSRRMRLLTLLIVGLLLSGTVIEQVEAWRFFRRIGSFFKRAASKVFNVVTKIPIIGDKVKAVVNVVRSVVKGDIKGALVGAVTNFGPLAKIRSIANVVSKIPGVGSRLASVTGALNSVSRLDFKGGIKHAKGIGGDLKSIGRAKIAVLRPIGGIVKSVARGDVRGAIGGVKQMATGVIGGLVPQMPASPVPEAEVEAPEPAPAASIQEAPPVGETAEEQSASGHAILQQSSAPVHMSSFQQQSQSSLYASPVAAPGGYSAVPTGGPQQPSPHNVQQLYYQSLPYQPAVVANVPGAMPVPFFGGQQQQQASQFNNYGQQQQHSAYVNQFGQLVPIQPQAAALPPNQHGQQQMYTPMMANGFAYQPNQNGYNPSVFSYPTAGASPVAVAPGQCYCPCSPVAATSAGTRSVVPTDPTSCGCGDSRSWMTPHDEDEYFAGDQEYIDEISVADGGRIPMRVLQVIRAIQAGRIGQYIKNDVVEDGRRRQPKQKTRIVRRVRIGKNGTGIAGRGERRR
ncbi:hypothetical protein BCR44DRAFT_1440456 [Catenaria anguillulae PL171]|uniref:Uncharacterized protein n=1 Tax=Catenaria anguillulae PL171 TaxID=765915 RepID=A0A1Y2HCI2_9FUNG|nr:hypothetical protein BCR44DRAFT_1440456 [Catenaria anguillulae PL171]